MAGADDAAAAVGVAVVPRVAARLVGDGAGAALDVEGAAVGRLRTVVAALAVAAEVSSAVSVSVVSSVDCAPDASSVVSDSVAMVWAGVLGADGVVCLAVTVVPGDGGVSELAAEDAACAVVSSVDWDSDGADEASSVASVTVSILVSLVVFFEEVDVAWEVPLVMAVSVFCKFKPDVFPCAVA